MLQGLDFSWHWNPIIVISLLLLCLLYVVAIRLARRYKPEETLPSYRIIAFASAIRSPRFVHLSCWLAALIGSCSP